MSSKRKGKRKLKVENPKERKSDWINFIQQERGVVPYIRNESGGPKVIPEVANESEYEAIPKKDPFQAYLPILSTKDQYASNPNNQKWFGTKIWSRNEPNQPGQETTNSSTHEGDAVPENEVICKGKSPDACNCQMPGSVDCVHRHMVEERGKLKAELGPAFQTWKFDEMGEDSADSWTLGDMLRFNSVMKKRNLPSSKRKTFLQLASQFLPNKSRASIVSYYFNFYLLSWRIRKRTRLNRTAAEIDTDDDYDEVIGETSNANGTQNNYLTGKR